MLIDTEAIFRDKTPDREKLLHEGFTPQGDALVKTVPLGELALWLCVTAEGGVQFRVMDGGEEYVLVHVASARGGYVQELRTACEGVLRKLSERCFFGDPFRTGQVGRIVQAIGETYGVQPEFPWKDTENAILRRPDNDKWFAALLTVKRRTLGLSGEDTITVLNLKAPPAQVEQLHGQPGLFPAYHMNKKHWFSAALDGTLPDAQILALVAGSWACTGK